MRVSTVLGIIVLVLIIIDEEISAGRFLKVEGSYMQVATVLKAIVLVSIITNEEISTCRLLKVKGSYMIVKRKCKILLSQEALFFCGGV